MSYHNEVHDMLKQHKGKNNAVTSGEIRDELGIFDSHDTHPKVRDIIRDLLEDGVPIASTNAGYYMVRNDEELNDYVESLQSRQDAIQERIDAVAAAYNQQDELDAIVSSVELKQSDGRKVYSRDSVGSTFKEMDFNRGVFSADGYLFGIVSSREEFEEAKERLESEYKVNVTVDEEHSNPGDIMVDVKPE